MRKIGQNAVWIGATLVAVILLGAVLLSWVYLRDDGGLARAAQSKLLKVTSNPSRMICPLMG